MYDSRSFVIFLFSSFILVLATAIATGAAGVDVRQQVTPFGWAGFGTCVCGLRVHVSLFRRIERQTLRKSILRDILIKKWKSIFWVSIFFCLNCFVNQAKEGVEEMIRDQWIKDERGEVERNHYFVFHEPLFPLYRSCVLFCSLHLWWWCWL